MLLALIAATALLSSQDAVADSQQTTSSVQTGGTAQTGAPQPPAQDPGERVVCRREHQVGSNRPIRTCRKQKEWDQLRDESLRSYNRAQRGTGENIDPNRRD